MILRQFAYNQPYLLGAAPIIVLSILVPSAWGSGLPIHNYNFPADDLFAWVYKSKELTVGVVCALVIAGSLLSNAVFNRHEFYPVPSYIISLVYAGLASAMCLHHCSPPALLAALFMLIGLNKQLQVFKQARVLSEYFESGFWFGMAAMFFPPFIILALGMWINVLFTRAFKWREHVLPIIAFCIPFLYWGVWKYWNNELNNIVLFHQLSTFNQSSALVTLTFAERLFYIITFVAFGLSLPRYLFLSDRASNKARSVKIVFFVMALSMCAAFLLGYMLISKIIFLSLLLPLTFIIGYWFANYRYSLIAPFVFYTMGLCILYLTISHYGLM
jgi:MFS family permease